jgi:serine/threonine-protein kinase
VPGGGVDETVEISRPIQVEQATVKDGTTPNVLGLGVDEARQALSDAGVPAAQITVRVIPYVAPEGSVVEQDPAPAAPLSSSTKAVLRVAKPATVPDLAGLTADEARRRLAEIGAGISTSVTYNNDVKPGTVVRTNPTAGQPAVARVSVVVSEEPSSVSISDLEAVNEECSIEDATLRGSNVTDALVCNAGGEAVSQEYALNKGLTGFEATLALADGAPSGSRGRLEVREGKRTVATFETSGPETKVDAPLTGAGRLRLVFRSNDDSGSVAIVLLDARILGSRGGIDELVKKTGTP